MHDGQSELAKHKEGSGGWASTRGGFPRWHVTHFILAAKIYLLRTTTCTKRGKAQGRDGTRNMVADSLP